MDSIKRLIEEAQHKDTKGVLLNILARYCTPSVGVAEILLTVTHARQVIASDEWFVGRREMVVMLREVENIMVKAKRNSKRLSNDR